VTLRRVGGLCEIPRRRGFSKAKIVKGKYEPKLEEGFKSKSPLLEGC